MDRQPRRHGGRTGLQPVGDGSSRRTP